jgi:hypothetical protein
MKTVERVCKALLVFAGVSVCAGLFVCAEAQVAANAVISGQRQVQPRITEAIDASKLVTLKGNVHPMARPEFDQGPVSDAQPMQRMMLLLQRSPEQEAALQRLLQEQQTKDSPNFHKWLTPQQFGQQFGPADADVATVVNWLQSQGFGAIRVGAGRVAVEFSGNAGMVRNAFHTEINKFLVNGKERQANASDPKIPAALAPVVAGIVSLHNFPRKPMSHRVGVFTRMKDGRVLPQFTGASGQFFAVGPADFAKIYNTAPLDGTGAKIAIIGNSNINVQDVRDFRTLFGLPPNDPNIVLNGPDPGIQQSGEEGEADLDVEWSGAVAPNAQIDFIVTEDTLTASGIDLGAFYVIDNNTDDVLSLSFGSCEANLGSAGNAFFNNLWEQAAAQGITVTVSAGDNGSAGCDDFNNSQIASNGLAVNGIASTPFNIAVGGTDFDDFTTQSTFWNSTNTTDGTRESALGYIHEIPWNDSCAAGATSTNLSTVCSATSNIVAASGGPSAVYGIPSWQNGVVPSADTHRDLPDVSLFASDGPQSKSFYPVCEADDPKISNPADSCKGSPFEFLGVGGTSASSPSFAAVIALIGQSEVTAGRGRRQGNANFVLYSLARTASNLCDSSSIPLPPNPPPAGCIFYDITHGNNAVPCAAKSSGCSSTTTGNGVLVDPANKTTPAWTAKPGYDYATGLGTVNVANLAAAWGTALGTFKGTTTSLKINNSTSTVNITHGTAVAAQVTVNSTTTGTPTGDVSLLAPTVVNGGIAAATLSGNVATLSNVLLPGGSYTVKAHYAGDGTFAASDDPTGVPVNVAKENSTLLAGIVTFDPTTGNILSTNATSFAYGSPYIFRADVLNSTGNASNCQPLVQNGASSGCAFDATGIVVLTDNGAPLDAGNFPLNSAGHTEDQPIQLSAGSHTLVATYGGDISYKPAQPVTLNLTVTKAATTVAVTASPSAIVHGGAGTSVTLTAIVNTQSSGVAPSGTVQFLNGTTPITGTVTLTPTNGSINGPASLKATLTTTLSALGVPQSPAPQTPELPLAPLGLASLAAALLTFVAARRYKEKRLAYACSSLVLLAGALLAMNGCGNSSSTSAQNKSISISAQYAGDSNYNSATGQTSIAVQ